MIPGDVRFERARAVLPPDLVKEATAALINQRRTYTETLTHRPTIEQMVELSKERVLSKGTKALTLDVLWNENLEYKALPGSTRFFSYFPFVNNKATVLRHRMQAEKALLRDHGVENTEIEAEESEPTAQTTYAKDMI